MSYEQQSPEHQNSPQPPPPGPQQPGVAFYPPQQEAPKKRKKWPWILGGIAVVMILGCIGVFALVGGAAKVVDDAVQEADQNQKGANAVAGKMNTPAKDGKFEFTVTGMKCGVASVGPQDFGEKAQGEFCLVDVSVKNIGTSAELFNGSSQKAYDAQGAEFAHDDGAAIYANDQSQTFLENINPGNQVKGKLVFDVPKGTKLASIVLHESLFTAGVRVPLS